MKTMKAMKAAVTMVTVAALATVAIGCDEDTRTRSVGAGASELSDREFCEAVIADYNNNRNPAIEPYYYHNGFAPDGTCQAGTEDLEGDGR